MSTLVASVVFGTAMIATPALAFIIYWQVNRRDLSWGWLILSAGCAFLVAIWFWGFVRDNAFFWNWGLGVVAGLTIILASFVCALVVQAVTQALTRVRGVFHRQQR